MLESRLPVPPALQPSLPRWRLILWGVLVAALVLLWRCPAAWVLTPWLRHQHLPAQVTGGTLWSGSLSWQWAEQTVPVIWDCHPDLLLRLDCHMAFKLGDQISRLHFTAGFASWRLQQMQAWVPAAVLMQQVAGLQLAAPVHIVRLRGVGDYHEPAHWHLQGRVEYAGGATAVRLQDQTYRIQLPPVQLQPTAQAGGLLWTLRTATGALLARFTCLTGWRYEIELAQRLLALSPLYQGHAWTPDRIDVRMQEHD